MKKSIYMFIIVVVITVVAYACTHDNEKADIPVIDVTTQVAFNDLSNTLDELNAKFPDAPTTRKGGRFWRIFGADFFGGLFGWLLHPVVGVIQGVSASCAAAMDYNTYDQQVAYMPQEEYVYAVAGLNDIGVLHNQIILEIFDENGETFYDMSESEMNEIVLSKVEKYCGELPNDILLQLPEVALQVEETTRLLDFDSFDASFDKVIELLPEYKNEVLVTKTYCKKLAVLPNETTKLEYNEQFNQIIVESSIPNSSKELIRSTISVAVNSNLMWDEAPILLEAK